MSDLFWNLEWNKKIEVLRIMKGWTQREAADRCFTNQKAYWSWENGQTYPQKNSRRALAGAFEISEEEIFKSVE